MIDDEAAEAVKEAILNANPCNRHTVMERARRSLNDFKHGAERIRDAVDHLSASGDIYAPNENYKDWKLIKILPNNEDEQSPE